MQCFNHPNHSAVGLCKNCSKGLCSECAGDEGYGLACKNRCEAEVKAVWELIEKNKSVYQKTSAVYIRGAVLYGLMGLMFALFPFLFSNTVPEMRYLFFGIGGLFLFGMLLNLVNASRMKKN